MTLAGLARLVIIIVSKSGFFHAGMVKSRLYSPLRDKYGSSKVPPPDLGTQIRTSLRYLSLKQSCVSVDKTLGLRPRVLSTETQLCFAERYLPYRIIVNCKPYILPSLLWSNWMSHCNPAEYVWNCLSLTIAKPDIEFFLQIFLGFNVIKLSVGKWDVYK